MADLAVTLREVTRRLTEAGVPSPEVDSLLLLSHALGREPGDVRTMIMRGDDLPPAFDAEGYATMVGRRIAREPLQHILGTAPFRGEDLVVGPGVFVPRPETEVVVQVAIDHLAATSGAELRAVDLCAGSGAMGFAMAREEPRARVWLVELSADAWPWLERNREALPADVGERVATVRGDARTALSELDGTVDVVATNPPYVPPNAVPREPEVADHDPGIALYGLGEDGLEVPRGVLAAAARLLRPGGLVVMEHADVQGDALREIAAASGLWDAIETRQDLTGRDRMLVATRTSGALA